MLPNDRQSVELSGRLATMPEHGPNTTGPNTTEESLSREPSASDRRGFARSTPFRVVAFDAVGTLIYAEPSVTTVYAAVLKELSGREIASEHLKSVLTRHLSHRSSEEELRTSEEQERALWYRVIAELVPETLYLQTCFDALFRHFAQPEHWRCYEDVEPALHFLREQDVQIIVASNFDHRLHAVCQGLEPLQAVAEIIVSSEVGWRKPAMGFFESVCRRTSVRPEEILFVGDDLYNDVHGATQAGMSAVWVDRQPAPKGGVGKNQATAVPEACCRVTSLTELPGFFAGSI